MNYRERVWSAVRHEPTTPTPYSMYFTHELQEIMTAYTGNPHFISKVGNHIDSRSCYADMVEIKPDFWQDPWGAVWNRTLDKDIGNVVEYLYSEPDIDMQPEREPDLQVIHDRFGQWPVGDEFRMADLGFSMFERAWVLRGMENLLTDMLLNPAFVDALMDRILAYNLKMMDAALAYNLDGFQFGDDWGKQEFMIMGPELWRRFIKPRLAVMIAHAKSKGLAASLHSCGDIHEVFPDLIDIGLDIYQTFQPEIYDMRAFKETYGSKLTVWGSISTQRLLPFATPVEIKRVVHETIGILGKNGGLIAAPTHSMTRDIPPEAVVALMEAFQQQEA